MNRILWAIVVGVAVLLVGLLLGVTGIFLVPIAGAVAIIVVIIWMLERKARDKPPIE